jgi:predicted small lipoprotein YifL
MSDHKKSLLRLSVAALAFAALVGCGLKGGLERPPPQFGDARAAYEAGEKQKAEMAAAEKAKKDREAKERQTMTIPAPSSSAQPPAETPIQAPPSQPTTPPQ